MPAKARAARSKPDQGLAKGHWSEEPVRSEGTAAPKTSIPLSRKQFDEMKVEIEKRKETSI
ncbi:hypothetical protein DV872_09345 [Oceanispirochaeta sp. M1]|nr:hypothetical protein DV872_09345 [Oceanispirochaeta sp. M1]